MDKQEMVLLNNYLQENIENANEEVVKLSKKLDLIVKQILLQEEFQKQMNEITSKIEEL